MEENLRKKMMKNNFISVGKIINFHGIKGEAKLGYSKKQENFLSKVSYAYVKTNSEYEKLNIQYIKFNPKNAIIKFKEINSLNEIMAYKGCLIFVEETVIRDFLDKDEFLIDELIGMNVYDGDIRVGSVVGVSNNGVNDLLSVKTNSKNICLVPFVKEIVPVVDIKTKKIQVNNIEGLLS